MRIDYFVQKKGKFTKLNNYSQSKEESPRIGETIIHGGYSFEVVDVHRYIERDDILVYLAKESRVT